MSFSADRMGKIDYSGRELVRDLEGNLLLFKEIFANDATFVTRVFQCRKNPGVKCAALFLDGMVNGNAIGINIIKPLTLADLEPSPELPEKIRAAVIIGNEVKEGGDLAAMVEAVLYGDAVVLTDGFPGGIIVNSKGFATRSVSEPDDEKNLRGPREGFTESAMMNTGLIRRKLQTSDLKFKPRSFGTRSGTRAFLCYLDSLVDRDVLSEIEKRLDTIRIDGVLDVNYIQELIKDGRYCVFKTCGSTEKPDIVAAKLLEGRVALILDGTPIVLTMPYIFIENLQVGDDYYSNFLYGTIGRLLRILGFLVTISAPAFYVSLISFHPEMIPTRLMLSTVSALSKVSFPTVVECIGMLIVFEVLRETGIRTPNKIGQALSIVGALIVGQAAVEARLVSAPVVIVVALTGITGLMVPRLSGAVIILRFVLIVAAACLGFYGYFLTLTALFLYLTGLKSFGIDYTLQLFTYNPAALRDIYRRAHFSKMKSRPFGMSQDGER